MQLWRLALKTVLDVHEVHWAVSKEKYGVGAVQLMQATPLKKGKAGGQD